MQVLTFVLMQAISKKTVQKLRHEENMRCESLNTTFHAAVEKLNSFYTCSHNHGSALSSLMPTTTTRTRQSTTIHRTAVLCVHHLNWVSIEENKHWLEADNCLDCNVHYTLEAVSSVNKM